MTYTAAPQSELAKWTGTRVLRRSLLPHEADRVVTAGRCIDADPLALPSVCIIGPCTAMGSAAAHPCDLAGSGPVHAIDLAALR
jgi:FAD dependent oxidoreductase